jgi:hypothetical protein
MAQFLNRIEAPMDKYKSDISKCMDGFQKDYWKECTLVDVLYSKPSNPILIIFGKSVDEICNYETNDTYAYRTLLRYWHSFLIEYPKGSSRETIEKLILDRLEEKFDAIRQKQHRYS